MDAGDQLTDSSNMQNASIAFLVEAHGQFLCIDVDTYAIVPNESVDVGMLQHHILKLVRHVRCPIRPPLKRLTLVKMNSGGGGTGKEGIAYGCH